MKLKEYLKALKNCPEEYVIDKDGRKIHRLTKNFGIYDNWPIYLNTNFENFLQNLKTLDFTLVQQGTIFAANYNPGTVEMKINNYKSMMVPFRPKDVTEKHKKDYSIELVLHHFQEKRIENVSSIRGLALVIEKIGNFAITKNIPLCFPRYCMDIFPDDIDFTKIDLDEASKFYDDSKVIYYP